MRQTSLSSSTKVTKRVSRSNSIASYTALVAVFLVSCTKSAHCSCALTGMARDYINQLSASKIPIVYSECKQPSGTKTILLLPIRTDSSLGAIPAGPNLTTEDWRGNGLLIFDLKSTCAGNAGLITYSIKGGTAKSVVLPDTGGPHTSELGSKLVWELSHTNFRLVSPVSTEAIISDEPSKSCVTVYDGP